MEGADSYARSLEAALDAKRTQIDSSVLPGMLDSVRVFLATFEGLHNILLKKGLVKEDPYKHEEKLSEIRLPSRERFAPAEIDDQMGRRLSQYHSQFDFLINYYEFTTSFLTLARLKQVTALVKYLDFGNLVETSPNPATAGLAQLLDRVLKGTDTVAVGIVKDAVAHLADLSRRILKGIAEVVLYQRECYKLDLRSKVMPAAALTAGAAAAPEAALAAIKRAAQAASFALYAELAAEVLAEDYPAAPADGEELRAKVLGRLKVEVKKEQKPKPAGPAPRELLLDALRAVASTEGPLRAALKTVKDSEELVARAPLTFGERLKRFFARAAGGRDVDKRYEIEYLDEARGSTRIEQISWTAFLDEAGAKIRALQSAGAKAGQSAQRIAQASDGELFDTVTSLCADAMRLAKRLQGLSAFFRSQVSPLHRSQIQSIHGDLAMVRSSVSRANRQKHEYVARTEEEEQFRKLGIAPRR